MPGISGKYTGPKSLVALRAALGDSTGDKSTVLLKGVFISVIYNLSITDKEYKEK